MAGIGVGGVAGYLLGGAMAKLPDIKTFPASPVVGTAYDIYFENFPPRTQLVSPRNTSVAGGDLVALGTTGADGILAIKGVTAVGPAGTYYLVAFDALTGKYCAVYTLIVR